MGAGIWSSLLRRLRGDDPSQPVVGEVPADDVVVPAVPTADELVAAARAISAGIAGTVPPVVEQRVARIVETIAETVPRLDQLGPGSRDAHSLMATVTSYLPESLGAYQRLPRSFADRRPIDQGRTALMVLVDQLDLLATTMDQIFDAACRADAEALVAHGRFLAEKFGQESVGGSLDLG